MNRPRLKRWPNLSTGRLRTVLTACSSWKIRGRSWPVWASGIDASLEQGHRELESLLGETDVLLTPAYSSSAKKHGKIYAEIFSAKKTFRWVMPFTALGNAYALPAVVIPCGRSKNGLPNWTSSSVSPGK